MAPKVIALCGKYHCGKDTVASFLCDEYKYDHVKISACLKEACRILFGLTLDQVEGSKKETVDPRWNVTPRRIMQFMGTEVMQYKIQELIPGVGRSFWIDATIRNIKPPAVISDLRFLHEYSKLKDAFGDDVLVLNIRRPSDHLNDDGHISENEHLEIPTHAVISNAGTIADLQNAVRACLDGWVHPDDVK